jgi:Leucine-rich repeat (LRR) protein
MVGKTMPPEWEYQLKCLRESCQLPQLQEEEALFGRLKLSYDNLDNDNPVSKECFLGFAAFPEDYKVPVEELIKWWKSQGLLDDPTNMFGDGPTQFAYYLVGLLIGRSLIEVVRKHGASYACERSSYTCEVHDVMRDLAFHIIEGQKPITCLYRPGKKLVEFPRDWIGRYKSQPCEVRKLSLMVNELTTLNGVTFSAPKLEVLVLSQNEKLEAMPKQFLEAMDNLKVLDLRGCCKLKSLPKEVGKVTQLIHLDLHGCKKLKSLPKAVGKLTQLIHLDLHGCNNLKSLPKAVGKLTQLIHLDLHGCSNLKSLPKVVGKLTQLIHLDLSSCFCLKKLPKSIGYLQTLQWLNLNGCFDLKYLPSTMHDLRFLQYLNLAGGASNGLWGKQSWKLYGQAFAVDICKLTALTELHICGKTCEIVELCDQLSKWVAKLVKLKSFHINKFDKLGMLPDVIESMVHLEEFAVRSCKQIKILPSFITLLSKLKVLTLYAMSSLESLPALNTLKMLSTLRIYMCKSIKKFPASFTSSDAFPSLEILDCFDSGLVEFLEVEDGAMPQLQILNLGLTNIKNLPSTLIYLRNLKVVYIFKYASYDLSEKFKNTWLSDKFHVTYAN